MKFLLCKVMKQKMPHCGAIKDFHYQPIRATKTRKINTTHHFFAFIKKSVVVLTPRGLSVSHGVSISGPMGFIDLLTTHLPCGALANQSGKIFDLLVRVVDHRRRGKRSTNATRTHLSPK